MALEGMGKRLVDLRRQKGFSQEQLGRLVGVSRQTVSKWELGESIPDTENIIQLGKLFEVTTDYLLLGEEADGQETQKNGSWPGGSNGAGEEEESDFREERFQEGVYREGTYREETGEHDRNIEENGGQEEGKSDSEAAVKAKRTSKILLISGIITGSIGGLGLLVIWVLSTMIKSFSESATASIDGTTWYYNYGPGYSFSGFVELYRLQALVGIFGACLFIAALLLVIRQMRKHLM